MSMNIGRRLKEIREGLGLSQEEFGEAIGTGVGQSLVSRREKGKRPISDQRDFAELQLHLNSPTSWALNGKAASPSSPLEVYAKSHPVDLFSTLDDKTWSDALRRSIWPSSLRPYEPSAILKAGGFGTLGDELPGGADLKRDLDVHGEGYLLALAEFDSSTSESQAGRDLDKLAEICVREMLRKPSDGNSQAPVLDLLTSCARHPSGPFPASLDLLAVIWREATDETGQLRDGAFTKIEQVVNIWTDRRDQLLELSSPLFNELVTTVRVERMKDAISKLKMAAKRRRGRPSKLQGVKNG